MTQLDSLTSNILSVLLADTAMQTLFNNKVVFRHGKAAGDEKMPYLIWDFHDEGPKDNTPISNGVLIFDIWDMSTSTRRCQEIITRLKILLHKINIDGDNLVKARLWWMGQTQILTDDTKVPDKAERHFRCMFRVRFYDMDLHEAELTE